MNEQSELNENRVITIHCRACGKEKVVQSRREDHLNFAIALCSDCAED